MSVDEVQARTTLEEAASLCGVHIDIKGSGKEVRIDCPFGCVGDHFGRKEVAINAEHPQKIFMCHSYSCKFRGNLLTLMHGWLTGAKPTDGKLKGDEFRQVGKVLSAHAARNVPRHATRQSVATVLSFPTSESIRNIPLIQSSEEKIREIHNIDEKFIVDVAAMSPTASTYVRRHPCLSPESMKKWRCGYLPNDGGGDKRGWSLRGNIIYPVLSEDGLVLAWAARDVQHEDKEREFGRLSPTERAGRSPSAKHRFPKGFHRSTEFAGQQRSRLGEPGYREFIDRHGILVVEGFNDVIGLDNLGIPAVGIMSNRITEAQVEKLARWAKHLTGGRVTLMFDCDEAGDEGAKEALWLLTQCGLTVRLAWTRAMHGGHFIGRQPESLTLDEWRQLSTLAIAC